MTSFREYAALLTHPLSGKPLLLSKDGQMLTEPESGGQFPVADNIPLLLPPKATRLDQEKGFDYAEHYQQDAIHYDYFNPPEGKTEGEERRRLHQFILAQIPAGNGFVLDAGCGGGWLAQHLLPSGRPVISSDISDINPRNALQRFPAPNHFALVADSNFLPLRDNSLDCIVASEIMEHVPEPAKFTASLYRALKSGGKLIITTPYNEFIRYSLCIHCNRNTPHNAHLHSFTEKSIPAIVPKGAAAAPKIFGSKVLTGLRLLPAFSWLPFSLYEALDRFLVAITGKRASRLMVIITKP